MPIYMHVTMLFIIVIAILPFYLWYGVPRTIVDVALYTKYNVLLLLVVFWTF